MTFSVSIPFGMGSLLQAGINTFAYWQRGLEWWMHTEAWPWLGAGTTATTCGVFMQGGQGRGGDRNQFLEPGLPSGGASPYHVPVLPAEVLEFMQPGPGKLILDGTLGGGGHTELMLQAGAQMIALDQDIEAIEEARQRLRAYETAVCLIQGNFRDFPALLEETGITALDGILVDLGVSSHQLDDAARGFSFQHDGPLDMRMNASAGRSAANLVNEESEVELERIFRDYGEERHARRIARAIVKRREQQLFETTGDLASFIASVSHKHGRTHPATLCFQALRIAVNDELGALEELLRLAPQWLKPGGRLVVISFHSLEDRMVKQAFQRLSVEWLDKPEWPEPRRNPDCCLRLLTRKPREATEAEQKINPRSRSAKLRAVEKLQP
jgi:16S rRNA (cytosine1402-N4)-methyltransferase